MFKHNWAWKKLATDNFSTVLTRNLRNPCDYAPLNLLCPKSFQKQFGAFFKALEFQTICSRKTYATDLRMFGRCLFVCFQSR